MAKYVFYKCTSCQIAGVVYHKRDDVVFDTEDPKWKKVKAEIEAAAKSGHLSDISKGSNEDRKAKSAIKNTAEAKKAEKLKAEKLKAETLEAETLEAETLEDDELEAKKGK